MHGTISIADFITVIILTVGLIEPLIGVMSYSDDIAQMDTIVTEVRSIIDAPEMVRPEKLNHQKINDSKIDCKSLGCERRQYFSEWNKYQRDSAKNLTF